MPGRNRRDRAGKGYERGNSYHRRCLKMWLLETYGLQSGRRRHTIAWCWECGAQVALATIVVDRIIPGEVGGTYDYDNIRPHCCLCSCRQGQRATIRKRFQQ